MEQSILVLAPLTSLLRLALVHERKILLSLLLCSLAALDDGLITSLQDPRHQISNFYRLESATIDSLEVIETERVEHS